MAIACGKLFSSWSEGKRKKKVKGKKKEEGEGKKKEGLEEGGKRGKGKRGERGGPGIAVSFQEHSLMTRSPLNSAIVPTVPWAGEPSVQDRGLWGTIIQTVAELTLSQTRGYAGRCNTVLGGIERNGIWSL